MYMQILFYYTRSISNWMEKIVVQNSERNSIQHEITVKKTKVEMKYVCALFI